MTEFRVALRHTTLLDSANLQDVGEGRHFIATAVPPPTNSILTLDGDEGEERTFFLVDQVFEVESDTQKCGVVGKLTDAQAHAEASMLGTEHLEDGEAPADAAPAMAMPAPVVEPEPEPDEVDEAERQRLEAGDSDDGDGLGDAADDTAPASDDGSGDEDSGGGRKGRRRRGRKRR